MKIQNSTGAGGSGLRRLGGGCFGRRLDGFAPAAIAADAFDGGERAVILALALGHVAKVDPEAGLLFLRHGFGDALVTAVVMAADVIPEFAVVGAGALPGPGGVGEFLDEHLLVGIARVMGSVEAGEEVAVFGRVFVGQQEARIAIRIRHIGLLPPSDLAWGRDRLRNSIL